MNGLVARLRSPRAAVTALLLLPLLVYGRFIAGDELYNADVFLAYRPTHEWLADGLRRGRVPLWTDAILGGFPIAFSEYGWFSPLNWAPLFAFGGHAGYYAAVALYVGLAGLSSQLLARDIGSSRTAALLAGLVYGQSLFVVGGAPLLNQGAAYWSLPAGLLLVRRAFRGERWAPPMAGVLIALTLLGSHPQLAIVALVPPALYAVWSGVRRGPRTPLLGLATAAALGAAIATLRYLPTLPLVAASERAGGLTLGASAIGSVPPHALLAGLLAPSLQVPRYLTPQWSIYVGVLPLALALGARGVARRWLMLLALAGSVIAFGDLTPIFWLLQQTPLLTYFREPSRFLLWTVLAVALLAALGLDRVRWTAPDSRWRAAGRLVLFGVAPLAGAFGAAVALRAAAPRLVPLIYLNTVGEVRQRDFPQEHYAALADRTWFMLTRSLDVTDPGLVIPLLSLLLAVLWWALFRTGTFGGAAAVLVTAVPLLAYGQVRLPAVPRVFVEEQPTVVSETGQSVSRPARVLSWLPLAADFENRVQLEGAGLDANVASYRLLKRLLAPNFTLQHGTAQLDGYENLMTREQAVLTAALGSERASTDSDLALVRQRLPERRRLGGERWGLMESAGVGTLLSVERLQPMFWPAAARFEPGAVRAERGVPSVTAFHMLRPAPRAYVTGSWRVASSADDAALSLAADDVDGRPATVITLPAGGASLTTREAASSFTGDASIALYGESRVELEVTADTDALLVLLDAHAPGWSATLNGTPVEILTANVAFRAIELPAGRHRVIFRYEPPNWGVSLAVSAGAAALLAAWLWRILPFTGGRFTRKSSDASTADS